ncbi:hypothetical protein VOLCADRAFT_121578 [Volvox carteri f. nagariensis]|uniref:RRM domain-containing protein n=1 Tax=Volvox carteri f. nagariensis TaxID=3068 RepID=D8UE08_VOLCA|nr:uncharacterized protein VOLCADRAFT_121578 [Volvox carteri f. nagariensis]EFJ42006.1 hypothetical protein VOLCADRAFT_121578 [Volvox carteri f. nagariensis]|eukprot:XP_002956881.1 hypothetical protein VOLCADRAFT_121578 [Volvox carteri f. nagariensis]
MSSSSSQVQQSLAGTLAAPITALPHDGSVVKMKGLPFKGGKEDIIKFFAGFTVRPDQVFLRKHPDGRPNGEAFVVFEDSDEARRATQKDRETFGEKFGDRYVRVYPTLDSDIPDMQAAVAQAQLHEQAQGSGNHGHGAHSDSVVKIKSLPFDATQLDIIQFFENFKLKPNGVQLVVRSDNKPTGEAFVDFETPEEAARSIKEKDHKVFSEKFGDRYVRLIQVSRKEMQATLALRFGGEGVLKMKGIPFKATAVDVRKFFTGYKVKTEGVSFIMHADGRPTGMAFIEFETPQEAVRAMEKDRAKFGPEYGDRFCMLQLVGRHEMEKVTLQRENENTANKLLNGINVLQAAALATHAALNNPALQPILMAGPNPWLNPIYQGMGLVNPATANPAAAAAALAANAQLAQVPGASPTAPMLDASALSAATQYGGPLPQGPQLVNGGMNAAALSLLQQQQAPASAGGVSVDPTTSTVGWPLDPAAAAAASNLQLFYQNAASTAPQDWARAAAATAADPRLVPGMTATLDNMPANSVTPHSLAPPTPLDLIAMKETIPVVAALGKSLGVAAAPPLHPPVYGAPLACIRPEGVPVPPAAALAATAAAGMPASIAMPVAVDDPAAVARAAAGNSVM